MLGDEHTDDCQQVIGEVAGRIVFGLVSLAKNHEPRASLAKEPLQELDGEARESVTVGNHNFCDIARVDAVQKGNKSSSLPVDPAGNVGEELCARVRFLELLDLTLEVGALVLTTDSGVEQGSVGGLGGEGGIGSSTAGKESVNVVAGVAMKAPGGDNGTYASGGAPALERVPRDCILFSNGLWANVSPRFQTDQRRRTSE